MEEKIGFAPDLVDLVKSGQKTTTYRLGDKYDFLKIGSVIKTKNSETGEVFAELKIVNKFYTTFKDLPITDSGHEPYDQKEEQRKVFEKYYGREVKDDEKVIVLKFTILKLLSKS
jgi:hypothetical protein